MDREILVVALSIAMTPLVAVLVLMATYDVGIAWLSGGAPVGDPKIAHAAWVYGGVYFKWLPLFLALFLFVSSAFTVWRAVGRKRSATHLTMFFAISVGGAVVSWILGAMLYISFIGGI